MTLSSLARTVGAAAALAVAGSALSIVPASATEATYTPDFATQTFMSQRCGGDAKVPNQLNAVILDVSKNYTDETHRIAGWVIIAEVDSKDSGRMQCAVAVINTLADSATTSYSYAGSSLTITAEATGHPAEGFTRTSAIQKRADGTSVAYVGPIMAPKGLAISARMTVSGTETATTAAVTKTVKTSKKKSHKRAAKKTYQKSLKSAKKAYQKAHHGSKAKKAKATRAYKARRKAAKAKFSRAVAPKRKVVVVTPVTTVVTPFTITGHAETQASA